jgi:DNA topoisomerase-1
LKSPNVTLKPHQAQAAAYLLNHRGLLAYWGTGTGKTLAAAASASCLVKEKVVSTVIVLTKKSALAQFRDEVLKFWPEASKNHRFVYATAQTFFRVSRRHNPEETLLVVDEAHEFTSVTAGITKTLVAFALRCKRVMLLTATPYVNGLYDLAPLMAMVKGEKLQGKAAFEALAADRLGFETWLRETTSVQIFDKSASPDFAKVTLHDVSVPMGEATWAEYMKRLVRRQARKKPFYMDLRELSMGASPDECEKCDWIEKHVKKWMKLGEGKVVIYTSFLDHGVKMIEKTLTKAGATYAVIDGSKSSAYRHDAVTRFNRPPRTRGELKMRRSHHRNLAKLVEEKECSLKGSKVQGICAGQVWFERRAKPLRSARASRGLKHDDYGYTYYQGGHLVTAKDKIQVFEDHVAKSPIPPAWTPAYVCKPNKKMMWAAKDRKGRWQRRYSEDWNDQQEFLKVMRLKRLTSSFWRHFHKEIVADMGSRNPMTKLAATATALMEACRFRPGWSRPKGDEKADKPGDRPHYGVSTLLRKHVKVEGSRVDFEFLGKSGKMNHCAVEPSTHPALVKSLKEIHRSGGAMKDKFWAWKGSVLSASALQDYLKKREIRAKDFRTYFANYTLVDMLRSYGYKDGKGADEVDRAKRRRALAEVYRTVSKGLNNTPSVAKKSYVFSGLWVLYLVDPVMFTKVVGEHRGKTTANLLAHLVDLFEKEQLDWRELLKELQGEGASSRNMEVILITDAGAESMDLKGVRHIVLSDPTWTDALRKQIIGRGQRYMAHKHLPPSQRRIDVWELYLDPPKGYEKNYPKIKSADRLIGEFARRKAGELEMLHGVLSKVSVTK